MKENKTNTFFFNQEKILLSEEEFEKLIESTNNLNEKLSDMIIKAPNFIIMDLLEEMKTLEKRVNKFVKFNIITFTFITILFAFVTLLK